MLYLSKKGLQEALSKRGIRLSQLAKECGVSRQSLYSMFSKRPVFNTSFTKILHFLGGDYRDLTYERSERSEIMKDAPSRVQRVVLELVRFCEANEAALILFGSRSAGKKGVKADWDFGIFFEGKVKDQSLPHLKQQLADKAFPYRIDIVCLNQAPDWFLTSIQDNALLLHGSTSLKKIFGELAA